MTVFLSLLGVSLAACTGESHKKTADTETVPVVVGRVQKVQEREKISVSGTVSTPKSPANVSFLVSGKVMFVGPREGEFRRKGAGSRLHRSDRLPTASWQRPQAQDRPGSQYGHERAEDEFRRMKMLYDSKSLAPNDFQKYKARLRFRPGNSTSKAVASEKLVPGNVLPMRRCVPLPAAISRKG